MMVKCSRKKCILKFLHAQSQYCDLLSPLVCRQFDIILHSYIDHISRCPYESTTSSCPCSHSNSLEKRYRLPIWTNILFCSLKKKTIKTLKTFSYINSSLVLKFKRWWVLKSKIFGQESTYLLKGYFLQKSVDELQFIKKCQNLFS